MGWTVQVRMMLEDTSEAMLDASRNGCAVPPGTDAGVYIGCVSFEYATILERAAMKVHTHCPLVCSLLISSGIPFSSVSRISLSLLGASR